jgi:hypothetical protein
MKTLYENTLKLWGARIKFILFLPVLFVFMIYYCSNIAISFLIKKRLKRVRID